MRKYIPHILIISFVFLLAPTAQVASYAGELEDAKEKVRKNPDDAGAHNDLGCVYASLSKHKLAIESYKQAIWIDPYKANAHFNLALSYHTLAAPTSLYHERAIKHYNKAIIFGHDVDHFLIKVHYNLGLAYIFLSKDRWAAEEQIEKLQDLGEWKSATRLKGMISTELD